MMIDQFRVSNPYNSTAIAVVATAAAAAAESQGSRGKEEIRTRAKATEKERKRNTHGTTTNVPHTCMLKINNTNPTLTKRHKRSLSLSLTVWEHECLCLAFGLVDWFFGCLHKLVCVPLNGAALCLWISVCASVWLFLSWRVFGCAYENSENQYEDHRWHCVFREHLPTLVGIRRIRLWMKMCHGMCGCMGRVCLRVVGTCSKSVCLHFATFGDS